MALRECPDCKAQVSDAAPACPKCGRPLLDAKPSIIKITKGNWIFLIVLVIGFMFLYARGNSKGNGEASERSSTAAATNENTDENKLMSLMGKHAAESNSRVYGRAESIYSDYKLNEVSADNRYKGKSVTFKGYASSISKDFRDSVYIDFAADKHSTGLVRAELYELQIKGRTGQGDHPLCPVSEKVANIKKGQEVVVMCFGRGMLIGTPIFEQCLIMEE